MSVWVIGIAGCCLSYVVGYLDGWEDVGYSESASGENFFIAAGMEVCEAFTEFDFFAIDGDGSEGTFILCGSLFGQGIGVDAEEPSDACFFEL